MTSKYKIFPSVIYYAIYVILFGKTFLLRHIIIIIIYQISSQLSTRDLFKTVIMAIAFEAISLC
jgi:hypothetical protein